MLHGPITITEEIVGDVAILRVDGRLTIGEPSRILHDCFARLLSAGQRKILGDLAGVPHIDSSGIATIARTSIALNRRGGTLKLSAKPGRVNDAFIVKRLAEAINIFPSVEDGLRAFAAAPFYCFCPICGSRSEPPAQNEKCVHWRPQICIRCDCQFTVTCAAQGGAILEKIKILPYGKEDEYVEILPGSPVRVMVVGRLDLFSSRALQNALHAIPVPRMVAIDS